MADTTSTTLTYLDRISVGKEAKEKQDLVDAAEDAGIQLQSDISAAKKEKRNAERALESAKSAIPLESSDVIVAARALKEVTEDLAELLSLQDELFGTPAVAN